MKFQNITDILEDVTHRISIECFPDVHVFNINDLQDNTSNSYKLVHMVGDALSPIYQEKLSKYFSSFGANLLIISFANELACNQQDIDFGDDEENYAE